MERGELLIGIARRWTDIYETICRESQQRKIVARDFDPIAEMVAANVKRTGIYKDEADRPSAWKKNLQFAGTSLWTGKLLFILTVATCRMPGAGRDHYPYQWREHHLHLVGLRV